MRRTTRKLVFAQVVTLAVFVVCISLIMIILLFPQQVENFLQSPKPQPSISSIIGANYNHGNLHIETEMIEGSKNKWMVVAENGQENAGADALISQGSGQYQGQVILVKNSAVVAVLKTSDGSPVILTDYYDPQALNQWVVVADSTLIVTFPNA